MANIATSIIVVTLNPAIDRIYEVPGFEVGQHQRGQLVSIQPAGKGANVSRILSILGSRCTLTGFVGEEDRPLYEENLDLHHVQCEMFDVKGHTRENFTIVDPKKAIETHIRDVGFEVAPRDLTRLNKKLGILSGPEVIVILTGSLPPGMTGDDFQILARKCQEKGSLVIVDSSGEGLQAVSQLDHLFLIKPNCEELAQITGQNVEDEDEILRVARSLLPQVQLVAVTAGARGAHLVSSAGVWRIVPPDTRQRVINTVGCGDALLAGFVHRYAAGAAPEEAMRYGVATGTASSFQVRSGEVELDDVTTCYEHVTLEKIDQNPG